MIRQFNSEETYYAKVPSPAETLVFEWDTETGIPTHLEWAHGDTIWFLYQEPSHITAEVPDANYYDVNLRITTKGYEDTAYPLKGKLTVNVARPSGATFAAIQEGTRTAWLVADGSLM